MDEKQRFGSSFEPARERGVLSDRMISAAQITAVLATAVGFLFAITAVFLNLLPLGLIVGAALIILGSVAGHIARRARPHPITVTQLVWRVTPTVGCLLGCVFAFVVIGSPFGHEDGGTALFSFSALAGVGALWGTLCAFSAWLAHALAIRFLPNRNVDVISVSMGSVVGGLVGFALLAGWRGASPWALAFAVLVTIPVAGAVVIRSIRSPARP